MNEAEWLACNHPGPMLTFVADVLREGRPDGRKDFLLAHAAGRLIWLLFKDARSQRAVEWGEAFADDADFPVPRQEVYAGAYAPFSAAGRGERGEEFEVCRVAVLIVTLSPRHAAATAFHLHREHGGDPATGSALVRDIFGNPFRPARVNPEWRTDTVLSLAQQMYESRDFSAMPILADALQDAGCDSEDILTHCRDANAAHVRGCWACDLVLEKQ
jgi:hypothetical protein